MATKIREKQQLAAIVFSILRIVMVLAILCLVFGIVVLVIPYEQSRLVVDRLTQDGKMESFTPMVYQQMRIPSVILFCIGVGLSLAALIYFHRVKQYLIKWFPHWIQFWKEFFQSWQQGLIDLKVYFSKKIILSLFVLIGLAFCMRIFLLWQPMEHDESYTSVVFAFQPLYKGLSDYHFPNNHVFHTFLVHIAYLLFGAQEWAVRLPAFVAGVLMAPLGFILAERRHNEATAWLAGIMIAVLPELIGYAVSARGYTLLAVFTLLIFITATYAKHKKNPAAWFLMGLIGAFGFYTLPIMVYPLCAIYTWLGLSWLVGDYDKNYSRTSFAFFIFLSGLLTVFLGLSLYIPVFRNWGFAGLFDNQWVQAMPADTYLQTVQIRLSETWNDLNRGIWPGIGMFLLLGYFILSIFHRRMEHDKIPLPLTTILAFFVLVCIQRPNILSRTWYFFIPLVCIWGAAGLVGMANVLKPIQVKIPWLDKISLSALMLSGLAIFYFLNGISYVAQEYPLNRRGQGEIEQATVFLKELINKDDLVIIAPIDDAPMWFYFFKYDLGNDYFFRNKPFEQIYVVVNTEENQDLDFALSERGPDAGFIDRTTTRKLTTIGGLELYSIQGNQAAIEKAYAGQD